uniref:Ribosomal protein S11 n=1 Tax=Psammoneis japonica TaxID=517775 RepID=A0A2U9GJ41_9STRA|nr:ribosomal protein S11 [Psammoneis japonica]AWQ64255.1 ribosomal protein S11 [Psammoneis japonica]
MKIILKYKNYIKNLKNKTFLLKKLKKQTSYKNLKFELDRHYKSVDVQQSLIMYVINITLTNKNTIIYVTDIKGNLKFYQSTSTLNMTGKQKTKQPGALLRVLKEFLSNAAFLKNKPIALHFNNVKKRFILLLINLLKNILFVKVIRIYNFLIPHNGCRPKKIKRR